MRRLTLLLTVCALAVWGGAARAAVVAVLDVKAAMAAHPGTDDALKELEDYRKKQFGVRSKALDDEVKKRLGNRDPSALSDDEQRELLRLRNEFEAGFERDVAKKDLQLTDPIVKDIRDIVAALSREKGFEIVVDSETVFFPVGGPMDITDTVITRLKKK